MNRFVVLAIAGCIASTVLSAPAYAGPILPDPAIGIRGLDDPPEPLSVLDATPQAMDPCVDFLQDDLAAFFCAGYRFSTVEASILDTSSINAVDLAFWDNDLQPVPNQICDGECFDNYFPASLSDFHGLVIFEDGFTVGLRATVTGDSTVDLTDDRAFVDLLIFSDLDGFVSMRLVNTRRNLNADLFPVNEALVLTSVPEPSTMVLIGTGLVGLIRRRRSHRSATPKA